MTEWKPGDVAMATFCGEGSVRVVRYHDGWARATDTDDYIPDVPTMGAFRVTDARPLVVIDPEDREAVERLLTLFQWPPPIAPYVLDDMQAALREFANPKPPRPEEPSDPAARVWAGGTRWAKVGTWWVTPALDEHPRVWDYLIEQEDFSVE